jgi:hypothetical protein
MITGLERLLSVHGYLSAGLIRADDAMPVPSVLRRTFGSLLQAYALAGWTRTRTEIMSETVVRRRASGAIAIDAQSR